MINISKAQAPKYMGESDDRIYISSQPLRAQVLLADGATGVGYGKLAAETFIKVLKPIVDNPQASSMDIQQAFSDAEFEIGNLLQPCDTTGVWFCVEGAKYKLASIGDSSVLMLNSFTGELSQLSFAQKVKPRVGNGSMPPMIMEGILEGPVLVCSDGLVNTLGLKAIQATLKAGSPNLAQALLSKAIVVSGGKLVDDVSAVVVTIA